MAHERETKKVPCVNMYNNLYLFDLLNCIVGRVSVHLFHCLIYFTVCLSCQTLGYYSS